MHEFLRDGLNPPYSTIVADPPWPYGEINPPNPDSGYGVTFGSQRWCGTTWFRWPRPGEHSAKPDAFMDLVEEWCPGPYVEVFCRRPRLGWDSWGYGYEQGKSRLGV